MFSKSVRFFSSPPAINFVSTLLKKKSIAAKLDRIYTHTFNQQLLHGTLSTHAFGRYLHDDYIYLHYLALGLDKLHCKTHAVNPRLAELLGYLSTTIIAGEQAMQENYYEYFTHTPESKAGPAVTDYIDFFTRLIDTSNLPIALCSIYPCFRIYCDLGAQKLHKDQLTYNPYKEWITTYSKPDFVEVTTLLTEEINRLALKATKEELKKMQDTIDKGIDCELVFFNEVAPVRQLRV